MTRDGVSLGKATSSLICELQVISAMPKSIDPLPPLWGWGLLKLPDLRAIMSRAHMRKDENARELPRRWKLCRPKFFFPLSIPRLDWHLHIIGVVVIKQSKAEFHHPDLLPTPSSSSTGHIYLSRRSDNIFFFGALQRTRRFQVKFFFQWMNPAADPWLGFWLCLSLVARTDAFEYRTIHFKHTT